MTKTGICGGMISSTTPTFSGFGVEIAEMYGTMKSDDISGGHALWSVLPCEWSILADVLPARGQNIGFLFLD